MIVGVMDVLVIGGGLSGVLSAYTLTQRGVQVVLCEAQEKLGGLSRVDHPHGVSVEVGLHLNVMTPQELTSLNLSVTDLDLHATPLILDKTSWIPANLDALSLEQKFFFFQNFTMIKGGMENLFQALSRNLKCELSQIIQSVDSEDCFIKKIQSAQKSWEPKAVLFAIPFHEMSHLIPGSSFNPKILKTLKRQEWVSAVKLDFILSKKIYDGQNILFVPDGLGFFPSNSDPSLSDGDFQLSQWLFFISNDAIQNPEEVTKKIRAGKRWIKKAFPYFSDHIHWEKIGVIDRLFPKSSIPNEDLKEWSILKNAFWVGDFSIPNVMKEIQKVEEFLSLG